MSTRQEIENQMKELLGEGYCNNCKKLNFLKCYLCKVNYCSVACMILDDHEHAPGACIWDAVGKFDAGNKSTVPHKTNKQKKIEETLTYKVMKDKLPEHVKMGVHVSVQGRLKKALEKMTVPGNNDGKAKGDLNDKDTKQALEKMTVYDNKQWEGATEEMKRDSNMSNKDTKKALEKTVEYEKQDELMLESGDKLKINLKDKTYSVTSIKDDLSTSIKTQINAQSDEERRKIWKSFIEAREKELALLDNQLSALKLQN